MQKFLVVLERAEENYVWTGSAWRHIVDACGEPEYTLEQALAEMARIARNEELTVTDVLGIAPSEDM